MTDLLIKFLQGEELRKNQHSLGSVQNKGFIEPLYANNDLSRIWDQEMSK